MFFLSFLVGVDELLLLLLSVLLTDCFLADFHESLCFFLFDRRLKILEAWYTKKSVTRRAGVDAFFKMPEWILSRIITVASFS